LSLLETKIILEDKLSVNGKYLREIYEVVNHHKAWNFAKESIKDGWEFDEDLVKTLHKILMNNIMKGGVYRDGDVRINGSRHLPPSHLIVDSEIYDFYIGLAYSDFEYSDQNEIELAAYTHGRLVEIHPFFDGNGRLARILMNYQLVQHKFPIIIKNDEKTNYYNVLEEYSVNNNSFPLTELIANLEEEQLDFYLKQIKHKI